MSSKESSNWFLNKRYHRISIPLASSVKKIGSETVSTIIPGGMSFKTTENAWATLYSFDNLVVTQKVKEIKTNKRKKRNLRLSGSFLITVAILFSFDISIHPRSLAIY